MNPTLGGSLVVADGLKYDYCFREAIASLAGLCDEIAVTFFNQEDLRAVPSYFPGLVISNLVEYSEWNSHGSQERISYWQNETSKLLSTDWYFSLQADEVIHEDSFPAVRAAILTHQDCSGGAFGVGSSPQADGYMCTRLNLWGDCDHYLSLEPESRMPVGQNIVRLARRGVPSYGDGQSLAPTCVSHCYTDQILIYHMGFVRDPRVYPLKAHRMGEIYGWGDDPRIGEVFDPWNFGFKPEDCKPIPKSLPRYVRAWAEARSNRLSPLEGADSRHVGGNSGA
jgi:hypothetical protein